MGPGSEQADRSVEARRAKARHGFAPRTERNPTPRPSRPDVQRKGMGRGVASVESANTLFDNTNENHFQQCRWAKGTAAWRHLTKAIDFVWVIQATSTREPGVGVTASTTMRPASASTVTTSPRRISPRRSISAIGASMCLPIARRMGRAPSSGSKPP